MKANSVTILKVITSKIGSGATPRGGNSTYKTSGISLIRSQNVHDFKFSYDGLAFIDDEQAKALNNVEVFENDILLNITGDSIARACLVPKNILPARVNQHVSIVRCKDKEAADYVLCYLQFLKKHILSICKVGGTRNALTKDAIEKIEIVKQPNHKILGRQISKINTKLELNNKINQELEAMAKTLYDYWFVQFDFPFDFAQGKPNEQGKPYKSSGGKMVYNEELKREIPEGWEVEKISDCCDIIDCLHSKKSDYIYEKEKYYLLQLENIKDNGLIDLSHKFYVSKEEYKKWTARIEVKDHDIVITNAGRVAGLAQVSKEIIAGIGRNITAIRPTKINPTFLYYTFQGAEMKRQIKLNTDFGIFFNSLNVRGIKDLYVVRAPKEIEDKFEQITLPQRRRRELNIKQNQQLTILRDWLLPMLMNGQVTLRQAQGDELSSSTERSQSMAAEPSVEYK